MNLEDLKRACRNVARDAVECADDAPNAKSMPDALDTSDPSRASNVAARAAILFARVCGYNADNEVRKTLGESPAHTADSYKSAIEECFPELGWYEILYEMRRSP